MNVDPWLLIGLGCIVLPAAVAFVLIGIAYLMA